MGRPQCKASQGCKPEVLSYQGFTVVRVVSVPYILSQKCCSPSTCGVDWSVGARSYASRAEEVGNYCTRCGWSLLHVLPRAVAFLVFVLGVVREQWHRASEHGSPP